MSSLFQKSGMFKFFVLLALIKMLVKFSHKSTILDTHNKLLTYLYYNRTFDDAYPTIRREVPSIEPQVQLQQQNFSFNSEQHTLNIWTALCDERMKSSTGQLAVHLFTYMLWNFPENDETRKTLRSFWKCRMDYDDTPEKKRYTVEVPLSSVIKHFNCFPKFFSCFFDSKINACPQRVSLITGNSTSSTKIVEVVRQETYVKEGLSFCGSTIAQGPGSGYHNRNQFVEWMEYLRMIGVSQVFLPEPVRHPTIPLASDLIASFQFYKDIGFLETFSVGYFMRGITNLTQIPNPRGLYWRPERSKPLYYTYCYLKYGTKYSHTMVGDLDEMPIFNISKYGNVMAALEDAKKISKEKTGKELESFVMKDRVLVKCNASDEKHIKQPVFINVKDPRSGITTQVSTKDVLANDSRIISRYISFWHDSWGKSIYSSNFALMVWHHWNWVNLADVNYFKENATVGNQQSLYLLMHIKHNSTHQGWITDELLFFAHARGSGQHPGLYPEICANREEWKDLNWLEEVKGKLLERIHETLKEMDSYNLYYIS